MNTSCTRRISGLLEESGDQRQAALIGICLLLSSGFSFLVPPPCTSPDGRVREMLVSYGENLPIQGLKAEVGSESIAEQGYLLTSGLRDERAWRDVKNARCSGLGRWLSVMCLWSNREELSCYS